MFNNNIWNWLQGRKTAIGALMLLLIRETWFLNLLNLIPVPDVVSGILWIVTIAGSTLTGVGVISMIHKSMTKTTYADVVKENQELKK